jgi:glutamine cyclotransferase
VGKIELANIVPKQFRGHIDYVLNGIAYDKGTKKFYVTGKMWPEVFELELLVSK